MESLIEVRRAGFEAIHADEVKRLARQYGVQPSLDVSYEKDEAGLYRSGVVQAAWWGFNAALDSVVVELPKEVAAGRWADDIGYFKDDIIEAIHAAGIKTK